MNAMTKTNNMVGSVFSISLAIAVEQALKEEAARDVAGYSQYEGHELGYQLGRATRNIHTKMGPAVKKGDLVLFKIEPTPPEVLDMLRRTGKRAASHQLVFWSRTNKIATVAKVGDVVAVDVVSVAEFLPR